MISLSILSLLPRILRRRRSRHPRCDGFTEENGHGLLQRKGNGSEGVLRGYGYVLRDPFSRLIYLLTFGVGMKEVVDLDARAGGTAFNVV